MGFFDKLLGRDYKYYLNKCSQNIADNDLNEAMACLKHAEEISDKDSPSAKKEIEDKRKEIHHKSFELAIEQAKKYIRSGQKEAANNAIERAKRFATDEEKENIEKLLSEEAQAVPESETIHEEHVDGEEKVDGLSTEDKWGLYVTQLPFSKQEHFEKLGDSFKKGWIALQEGNFKDAVDILSEVHDKNPEDHLVMCELGRAYYGKGDFKKADELLDKSDEIKPEIDSKLLHAEILWNMKNFEKAENVLQAAHDMDPDNNNVLLHIAIHGLRSGDLESGIAASEVLLDAMPNDRTVQAIAGRLYVANKEDEKALECFENINRIFWQVNPQTKQISFDHSAALAAADLYVKLDKKLDRAIELYEALRAHSKDDTHIMVNLKLAEVYEKQKKSGKREEMLVEATRFMDEMTDNLKGPEKAIMDLQYAQIADMLKDKSKCEEKLNEAKSIFEAGRAQNPIHDFYIKLITDIQNGAEFPKGDEINKKLIDFVKERAEDQQKRQVSPLSRPDLSSQLNDHDNQADENVMTINVPDTDKQSAQTDQKSSDDIIKRMAAMSKPVMPPVDKDNANDEKSSEEAKSENAKASDEEIAKKRAEQNANFNNIIAQMASLSKMPPVNSNDNKDKKDNAGDEKEDKKDDVEEKKED